MAESRHTTVLEIRGDKSHADQALESLERRLDDLERRARTALGRGAPGGVGGGAPADPPESPAVGTGDEPPRAPSAGPSGGGGGRAPDSTAGVSGPKHSPPPETDPRRGKGEEPPEPPPEPPSSAGGEGGEGDDPRDAWRKGQMGPGAMAMGGLSTLAGALSGGHPAWSVSAMGGLGSLGSTAAAHYVGSRFGGRFGQGTARALRGLGAALPLGTGMVAVGVGQRYERAQRMGEIMRQQGLAATYGAEGYGFDRERLQRAADELGYAPEEAAGMITQFAQQAGYQGSRTSGILHLARQGVSPAAMAAYEGLRAPGAGGLGGNFRRMADTAADLGLRGANVDKMLSQIVASTSRLAEQGIRVDLDAMETFMARMANTRGPGGESFGLYAGRLAQGGASDIGSAKEALFGPFRQMRQTAVMIEALNQPGGLRGAARFLHEVGPEDVPGLTRKHGGEFMTEMAYQDLPPGLARRLAAGPLAEPGASRGLLDPFGLDIQRMLAGPEARRTLDMTTEDAATLVRSVNSIKDLLDGAGEGATKVIGLLQTIVDGVVGGGGSSWVTEPGAPWAPFLPAGSSD